MSRRSYDKAFGNFFARLKGDGTDETNTLFVVVPDENDHFVGSAPTPANCDGVTTPCNYAKVGEIEVSLDKQLLQRRGAMFAGPHRRRHRRPLEPVDPARMFPAEATV